MTNWIWSSNYILQQCHSLYIQELINYGFDWHNLWSIDDVWSLKAMLKNESKPQIVCLVQLQEVFQETIDFSHFRRPSLSPWQIKCKSRLVKALPFY